MLVNDHKTGEEEYEHLKKNALHADDPPEMVLVMANNENSSLVTDAEDDVYEADLGSEWKWDEDYFQKNNVNYGSDNENQNNYLGVNEIES